MERRTGGGRHAAAHQRFCLAGAVTEGGINPESSAGTFDFGALEHPPPSALCEVLGAVGTHQHSHDNAPPSLHRPSLGLPRHRFLSQRLVANWGRFLHINKPVSDNLKLVPPDGSGTHLLPTMLLNRYGRRQPAREAQTLSLVLPGEFYTQISSSSSPLEEMLQLSVVLPRFPLLLLQAKTGDWNTKDTCHIKHPV